MDFKIGDLVLVIHTDFPSFIPIGTVTKITRLDSKLVLLTDNEGDDLHFTVDEIVKLTNNKLLNILYGAE